MRSVKTIILLILCLYPALLTAMDAAPETYFIKISKALRGMPPSFAERQEFKVALTAGTTQQFIETKIQNYLFENDVAFQKKLKFKISELFRIRTDAIFSLSPGANELQLKSSYSYVVAQVLSQNLSWDRLFLHKKYEVLEPSSGSFPPSIDFAFYKSLNGMPGLPEQADQYFTYPAFDNKPGATITFEFDPADPRIAGIITTPRFFERFVNTALNKNRRRAAALFSTLLCENMAPTTPPPTEESQDGDFDVVLPAPSLNEDFITEDEIHKNVIADPHGAQPDCMACHYKLDPMGQVFGLSSVSLAPTPTPGHLRYVGKNDRRVDIPVLGVGGLMQTIVQQPEYVDCQIQHFWNWYIGKDVLISTTQQENLVKKFNELNRQPKDFIRYLLQLKEFKNKPEILNDDQILARRASAIFKNCNACHVNQDDDLQMKKWDMTQFPYQGTPKQVKSLIQKISRVLDLPNNGANKTMPPETSLWKIKEADIQVIQSWVENGAPDFSGKPQVTK